jgi:hypothetical protein
MFFTVYEVFNEFFVNVARDIGKDYIFDEKNHPSLKKIEEHNFEKNAFEFVHTNETFVSKIIDKINVKKATDVDKISVKLKLGKPSLVNPIANLITITIDNCHFPKRFKEAQVVPLFKKKDLNMSIII